MAKLRSESPTALEATPVPPPLVEESAEAWSVDDRSGAGVAIGDLLGLGDLSRPEDPLEEIDD